MKNHTEMNYSPKQGRFPVFIADSLNICDQVQPDCQKNRLFALLLALALLCAVLSGCGGSGSAASAGEPSTDTDQTSFTIMGGQSALSPGYTDNEVLKKLQEDTGITIEWNTMSDSLSEQVNIHIAGGDLPDAFQGVGFSNYELANYGADGTFIDLTPYITPEVMPNLSAMLDAHPEIRAAITMSDGKIYGLPSGEQMGTAGIGKPEDYSIFSIPQFSMINKAWLDDLGLEVPTTLDELHDVLAAFKENDMAAKMYGADPGSGNLSITSACKSPINLLKFYDKWYDGEVVMQLQYGPIGVFFTGQDENGVWNSITEEEAQEKFGKGAGELKSTYEVAGPKMILSSYYHDYFHMEDRAVERLTDLYDVWMPQVSDTSVYPVDCVFTQEELDTIDRYRTDFENTVSENEGLWIKNGGPTDEEWEAYKQTLVDNCGMDKLLEVYQAAYDRYTAAK